MDVATGQFQNSFHPVFASPHKYYDCIEACFECANSSWICADACLHEVDRDQLHACITLCLSAAEICAATARAMFSLPDQDRDMTIAQLRNCMEICSSCMIECQKHATLHEHCQISTKCCEECFKICAKYVQMFEDRNYA